MKLFTRFGRLTIGLSFVMAVISFSLEANPVKLNNNSNDVRITENTGQGFNVAFSFSEFKTLDIKTPKGIFSRIIVPSYSRAGLFGYPELPVKSELIEIPVNAEARVRIVNFNVKEYKLKDLGINYLVLPNQPPVVKTGVPAEFIYVSSAYKVNAFSPDEIASVQLLGTMRGVNIGRLDIIPVQYNPVTGMIRVYENLEIEVTFENADLLATELSKQTFINHYFSPVFKSLINFREPENAGRENFSRYPIKFVIVSDPMFEAQLQPLIEWKIKKGFIVVEAYTDDPNVGTTASQIKDFLQELYDNGTTEDPAPTFVLFVGDIAQVPTWTGQAAGHVTDLYYCEYTGDYFPEVFYGRYSAQNPDQLQPQIDKTLMYEQYTMPISTYLDTVVMIAGMDGTYGPVHGNGQINYGTENYFNESHGIYSHTYLYPESGSNAAQIRQNVSDGVTYANYTAHGSPDGWADPSFSVSNIPALQNDGKYGLLVGNCCSTSEYQVSECFGEAIVRAENKGAVGYIGASNSTYWDEDYYFGVGVGEISGDPPSYEETTLGAYDRMFHSHGEPFGEWYTTMDQMVFAGNLAVTEGSPGSAEYYWEAYCLMGDPSLMIYFSEPPVMNVTYDPLLPLGNSTFTVNAAPYAYVAVSMDGVGLGAALADSDGLAVVNLLTIPGPGNADVVVTAQNYQPFTGTVLIANPEGPYVTLNEFIIDDINGNNDGTVDFGEEILLDVELKNWGNADAVNTNATLSSEDEYVDITDNYQDYGTILSQDSVMQMDAFQFQVDGFVPDLHIVPFDLTIQDDTPETWTSSFSVTLHAPVLATGNLSIDDSEGGNGNSRLDPGETVNLVIDCFNNGHCDALDILAGIQSSSPDIVFQNTTYEIDTLNWGGTEQAVFTATLADEITIGSVIELNFEFSSGPYSSSKQFFPKVGLVLEDFESGNFEAFEWYHGGDQPWQITGEGVYEGAFSARSGDIGDSQISTLMIDVMAVLDDSISFYRKVSCEDGSANNYDWLAFYIDDIEMGRWDGEVAWSMVAYPVSMGEHTLTWVYSKDGSVSAGEDAAWIDFIIFPSALPSGPFVILNDYFINDELGNNNGLIDYGEDILLDMELKNMGGTEAQDVNATISTSDVYVTITDDNQGFGTIMSQDVAFQEDAFRFTVAELVPDMHDVELQLEIQAADRESWTSSFSMTLYAPVMTIGSLTIMDIEGGNGNHILDAGETVDFVLNCHNTGHCDAFDLLVALQSDSPYITILNNSVNFDTLLSNDMHQAVFSATLAEEIEIGTIIDLAFELSSGLYVDSHHFYPQVGMILEDFESGNFETFGWNQGGNLPWQITTEGIYEGQFSARSGMITDYETSELMIDLTTSLDDSISFYRRVSCEDDINDNYDWLAFYIDETEQGRWDGEVEWSRVSYPVIAGQHSVRWVYRKDVSVSSGEDAAWIDFVVFPGSTQSVSIGEPLANDNPDMKIYPNPSREHAELYIQIPAQSMVAIDIYDITGKKVMEVLPEQMLQGGSHQFSLESTILKPGLYFCKMLAGSQQIIQKVIISK